jgi:hypothetical protein
MIRIAQTKRIFAILTILALAACAQRAAEPTPVPQMPAQAASPTEERPPATPLAGPVEVLNEGFESGQMPDFWPRNGDWQIVDDGSGNKVLQTSGSSAADPITYLVEFGPQAFSDGVIQYRFRFKDWNPANGSSGIAYINFRIGGDWDGNSYTYQIMAVRNAGYLNYVTGTDAPWPTLADSQMEIQKDQWIRVRIEITGNLIKVKLNDKLLIEVIDRSSRTASGRLGFLAGPQTGLQYDDVQVWQTQQSILALTPAVASQPIFLAADSRQVLNENFESGDMLDFRPRGGEWEIVDDGGGNLALQTVNASARDINRIEFGPSIFSDGAIQFRFRFEGRDPNVVGSGVVKTVFRAGGAGGSDAYLLQLGQQAGPGSLYYSNPYGNWQEVKRKIARLALHQWNLVRIETNGDHVRISLNNQLYMDVIDDKAKAGGLGFMVMPGTSVQIDDVQVWQAHLPPLVSEPDLPLAPAGAFMKGIVYAGGAPGGYATESSDWTFTNVVKPLGATWVRLHTFCIMKTYRSTEINCQDPGQNNETDIIHVTRLAHHLGLRVMVEFSVFTPTDGPDPFNPFKFYTETQWADWFQNYSDGLLERARIAELTHADALEIGAELNGATQRAEEWRTMIAAVRQVYHGPLVYSSDHEWNWTAITWWDAVDYIGLHPYYLINTSSRNAGMAEMKALWVPVAVRLEALSKKWNRPILFTEFGYQSQDGIGMNTGYWQKWWEVDLQESADLFQAATESLAGKDWFGGMFVFNIDSTGNPSEPLNTDYTIYGKPSYDVIRSFYGGTSLPAKPADPTPPAEFKKVMTIFDDQLHSGWSCYPPEGQADMLDLTQTRIARSGSAIKATIPGNSELSCSRSPYIDFSQYQWLAFDLYIPLDDPLPFVPRVFLRDPEFLTMPFYANLQYSKYVQGGKGVIAGQWQHVLIPLSSFGPLFPPVSTIEFTGRSGTFYLDNISLLGG